MTEEVIIQLGQETIRTATMIAGPMLLAALSIGLIISIFQAITQINEATLTFIPKIVVVVLVIILAGPWMLETIDHFTKNLFEDLVSFVRENR